MTETTQPDPRVVARVVLHVGTDIQWEPQIGLMLRNGTARQEIQHNADGSRTVTIRARKRLTVADIPAGQGPASLYRYPDGTVAYKDTAGVERVLLLSPDEMSRNSEAGWALEAFLATNLPTIDTVEGTP